MTREEKAKAYDEALERAKNIYGASECKDILCTLKTIFPELRESEDERIRRAIINYIGYGQHCDVSNIDMIAWLEKQGEKTVIGNGSNSASVSDGDNSVTSKEVVSQQTGWSKEDTDFKTESVRYLCNLRDTFEESKCDTKPIQRCINWLLEIPKPQPKQEWSEEDEKEWKSIVSVLTRMHFLDELDWLRSKLNR